MINWPGALIRELAERRYIVFLGAGASAGCISGYGETRPPNWNRLLTDLLAKMATPAEQDIAKGLIEE